MAKNKISVDLEVDDKGSLKKVSNSANKTSQSLDKVAKGSSTTDRNIKGVAGASSNASKNFSKMSQGMGGLVGAYAALAAQIFAISAAFNFLKSAGDLKVLEASQQSYASNTGLAMRVLANDIVSATNATINFQDASQAAAIGTAAGLSPGQLKSLGKAASDLSVTLGRDVTDSFNRLIRGVTKAEPELLDELGIILRLQDAQEEYGRIIGKSANELTQFEKSQAVANKVLQEASRVSALAPEGVVNPYNQLGKAFDDILNKAKLLADQIVGPLAKVLTDTPGLAIASFGLLLKGPLAAMGVSFGDMASQARLNAKEQVAAALKAREAYKATRLTIKSTTEAVREQAAAALKGGSQSKILQQFAGGGVMTPQARATLKRALKAAEKNVNEHSIIVTGIFKGMDVKIVRDYQLAMKQMDAAEAGKVATTKRVTTTIAAAYATMSSVIARTSAFILTWGTRLLGAFGWIALAITAFQLLSNYMGWFKKDAEETADALEPTKNRLADLNKEYEKFGETQKKLIEVGRANEVFSNIATKSSMLSSDEFSSTLEMSKEYNKTLETRNKIVKLAAANQDNMSRNARRSFNDALKNNQAELDNNKEARKFIDDEINAINQVIKLTGMKPKFALDYLAVLKGTANVTEQEAQAIRTTFQERGNLIRQSTRLIAEAQAATSDWIRSLAPLSQGDIGVRNIQLAIDNLNEQANNGVRITNEQLKSLRELSAAKKLMVAFEKEINEAKVASTALDTAQENQLRSTEGSYKNILNVSYDILRAEAEITRKQNRVALLKSLTNLSNEENNARNREIELLTALLQLDEARLVTKKQEGDYLGRILQNEREIAQIRLSSESMAQAKEYLNILNTQVTTQKESINAQQTIAKLSMQRAERDIQRSNPFAFLREQERVTEATYQLELSMVGTKVNQINTEFDLKRQMIGMEHVLLDARLRVSELELRNRAEADNLREGEREAIQALAAATASQRALISQNLGGQFQLLDSQQQAAIEGIIDELDKLDFARQDLSDMAVITNTIVRDLHSGLSTVFSDLITNKVSSFKTAMLKAVQGVVESFAKTLSDMFARNLIEGFMSFYSTKQNNPILGAAQQGSLKVASTLKNGAAAVATAIRAAFAEGAARIAAQKEDNISKALSAFVGPPEKEKETSNDFFQNVFGTLGSQRPAPSGVPSIKAEQPATAAQKLGSMFGLESATFNNNNPAAQATSRPLEGMFSGLMKFMGNIFSMDNPLIKGFQAIFSKSNPLLQGLGGLFGKLFSGLGSILGGGASGISSLIGGFFGFANGGMVKGGFRAYANGGIATKPTLGLVGEGKYNEAIVPMPNGKAIPVDMKGSQGQNNNITINIDSAGGATTSGMSDQDNKQLGKAIAQAVQRELQNQKRSGGILSPYGVS